MHQHAVFANEVGVFGVDVEVVDVGFGSGSWEVADDSFGVAVQSLQPLTNFQVPRLNIFLPIHRPERMIAGGADGLGKVAITRRVMDCRGMGTLLNNRLCRDR